MISLYSGTPGSGKSLDASNQIRIFLKNQGPVIGTFPINTKYLIRGSKYSYYYKNIYSLTPKYLVDFAKEHKSKKNNPEGSFLLVIDEAQRIFNSRDWNSCNRNDWITFFAEHRHLGFDIILISQNDRMLDRQIRTLIEFNYIHRKYSQFGFVGKIFSIFTGQFVVVKVWYPLKEKVYAQFFRGTKKLYNFYNSYELFDVPENGGEGDPFEGSSFIRKLETIPCVVLPT